MSQVVATAVEDEEFFRRLGQPFTGDLVSTRGGERVNVAQVVELTAAPRGGLMVIYPSLEDYMRYEGPDLELVWHAGVPHVAG